MVLIDCVDPSLFPLPVGDLLHMSSLLDRLSHVILHSFKLVLLSINLDLRLFLRYFFKALVPCLHLKALLWALENLGELFQRSFVMVRNYQVGVPL